ncbi:MAG TPA: TRAP transporter permease DctM [Acetobacteraceae bacterium]|jgi:tripartite ATP-independent transporter DctM subunit|nr:TRAP transporter permease DctM [Acetobacteraceae bacterium]
MVTLAEDAALTALAPREGAAREVFRHFCGSLDTGARAIAAAGMLIELAIIVLDVLRREVFHTSFLWGDEASKMALSLVAFIGGAAAYRGGQHTSIRVLLDLMPVRTRAFILAMLEWTVIVTTGIAMWASYALIHDNWANATPILQVSTGWYALPLPLSMLLIAIFALERLVLRMPPAIVLAAGLAVAAGVAVFAGFDVTQYFGVRPDLSLGVMVALFFVAVLFGLPVSFAMLLSTLVYLQTTDAAPFIAVPQNMIDGTGNYILLALPFFIFAGLIMERGEISVRLVRFAMALVGRAKGGLLQVIVVTIYLVSGISGSKVADVAAVGSVMRGELKRRGYRPEQGAAALAASAAMAETIPPSIAMLVLGSVTPISIGTLFVAGLLPAAVIAACLMVLIWFRSRNSEHGGETSTGSRLSAVPAAILPLAMPVLMVSGIKFGIATPTEVSTFAVLYGLGLAVLVYRAVPFRKVFPLAMECAGTAGMVLFVLASAASFAWTLTAANLPQHLVGLLDAAGHNSYVFLAGSIVMLILIGSLLEGLPALIILAPLLMPIATQFGINGVQYATVLLLAMGVGAFMPPVGVGFYVACAVAESRVEVSAREMVPYLIVLVLSIGLIAFVPWITLSVPRLLGSPL